MVEHFPPNLDAHLAVLMALDSLTAPKELLKGTMEFLTPLKDLLKVIMEFLTLLMESLTLLMEVATAVTVVTALLEAIKEEATAVQAALEDQVTAPALRPMLSEAPSDRSITIDCSTTKSPSRRSTPTPEATAEIDGA